MDDNHIKFMLEHLMLETLPGGYAVRVARPIDEIDIFTVFINRIKNSRGMVISFVVSRDEIEKNTWQELRRCMNIKLNNVLDNIIADRKRRSWWKKLRIYRLFS